MNHSFVGTEHLLLGMIRHGPGIGIAIVMKMGISPELICTKVEEFVGFGPPGKLTNPIPYTPRVKKTLALAGKEAKALKHPYVGTQHLLLGLLRTDGIAAKVLEQLGVEIEATRQKVMELTAAGTREEWRKGDSGEQP